MPESYELIKVEEPPEIELSISISTGYAAFAASSVDSSLAFENAINDSFCIPATIFIESLTPLEALVKFLRENVHMRNNTIAKLLNRSEKSISQAYRIALRKHSSSLKPVHTDIFIPLRIFADRRFSLFEALVGYLRSNLSPSRIAGLLSKSDSAISTVYSRYVKKLGGK